MSKSKPKKKHILRNILIALLVIVILAVAGIIIFLKKLDISYPALPENPKTGEWYSVTPKEAKSSDGSAWHGLFRKGSENKVFVYFFGGGVSLNDETSQSDEWYFIPTVSLQDHYMSGGIFVDSDENPFKDWTFLVLEYSTGDFHTGTNEYHYTDKKGNEKIVYHNGYNNYSAYMDLVKDYIGEPDTLVITGSSAGGFATSLLADDVIGRIPSATNVTACIDSALLYYDGWSETAQRIWNAPQKIRDKLKTDNIVLDCLKDLQDKYPEVKILFTSSVRDHDLQRYQAYIDYGKLESSTQNSALYQESLARMISDMKEDLNNPGFYIWEYGINKKDNSTQHMIMPSNVFDKFFEDKSVAEWLYDTTCGDIQSYGLSLLTK